MRINPWIVLCAILNTAGLIALFEALATLHPANVSFLGRLYFVYALMMGSILFGERLHKFQWPFAALTVAGSFLAASQGTDLSMDGNWPAFIWATLYPLLFALQNAIVKSKTKSLTPSQVLLGTKLVAATILLALSATVYSGTAISNNGSALAVVNVATAAFLATFLGHLLLYSSLRSGSFMTTNLVKALEPLFVIVYSFLIGRPYPVSFGKLTGIFLILVGVVGVFRNRYISRTGLPACSS